MTSAERLILYVAQRIEDEGAVPSRTKILKILYLIDVEYFRRHRKTLTGWKWVFYKYGPYVFEYPTTLENLNLAGLSETEDFTEDGTKFFRYKVQENQNINDLVSVGDRFVIDKIIKRWALEDLNLLLNYVYFETEPMKDAERGEELEFNKIPKLSYQRRVVWEEIAPSAERVTQMRKKLAELQRKMQAEAEETRKRLEQHPFTKDEAYLDALHKLNKENTTNLPEGIQVTVSE